MPTLNREWHRALKRVVVAHIALAKSVKRRDRKMAQKKCSAALAKYRIASGKLADQDNQNSSRLLT